LTFDRKEKRRKKKKKKKGRRREKRKVEINAASDQMYAGKDSGLELPCFLGRSAAASERKSAGLAKSDAKKVRKKKIERELDSSLGNLARFARG